MNISAISYKSILGRLIRAPLRLLPKEAQIPILQGPLRGKKWIVGASNHGCWIGSFEYDKQHTFAHTIRPGSVVFDIGAQAGFYTLLSSVLVKNTGRVIAFEPLPRNVLLLREHIRLNDIKNAQVFPVAVADYSGTTTFAEGASVSQGYISSHGDLIVHVVSLDELVAEQAIPLPNYIKIDVEGAEMLVLTGAQKTLSQAQPTIFLATHGRDIHQQCCTFLEEIGYELSALDGGDVMSTNGAMC